MAGEWDVVSTTPVNNAGWDVVSTTPVAATQTLGGAAQAVGSGIAAGATDLGGLAVDTGLNIYNLAKAGLGYAQSKVTGGAPSDVFDPTDSGSIPFSSEWLKNRYRNAGLSGAVDATENTGINRYLHAGGEGLGASAGGGSVRGGLAAVTSSLAQQGASDLGAGQGGAAAAGLVGALVTHRLSSEHPNAPQTAQDALDRANANSPQSQGAAAASPSVTNTSPELQEGIRTEINGANGQYNPTALARHVQADRLGVQLTEGQATGDVQAISDERNNPELARHFNQQNQQLAGALQDARDTMAPDVNQSPSKTLVSAYEDLRDTNKANTRAAYKAAADANGGELPVNGSQWVQTAEAALKQEGRLRFVPSEVQGLLNEFRDGDKGMTLNDFENARTILGEQQRKFARSGDGTAEHAVSVVRSALENLPMDGDASANVKSLYDTARAAAKADFDAQRADPAYKAVVQGKYNPDTFAKDYVVGGDSREVAAMRQNLQGNDGALQAMKAAAIEHLRDKSGLNESYEGATMRQSGYNRALRDIQPKANVIFSQGEAERLGDIGQVLQNTQAQPEGSLVNNSHTVPAALRAGGAVAKYALEQTPTIIPGLKGYLAGKIEGATGQMARVRAAQQAIRPGAGIGNVPQNATLAGRVVQGAQSAASRMASELAVNGLLRRAAPAFHYAHGALSKSEQGS